MRGVNIRSLKKTQSTLILVGVEMVKQASNKGSGERQRRKRMAASSSEGRKLEEEEEVEEERVVKWAGHYSSLQQILLVGEGDFSFFLCLANAFGSASNIVATSMDSHVTVLKKYNKAKSNLERLQEIGATILHGIDATKMKFHTDLKMRKFDRIVFNFPHAGFKGKEDNMRVINLHRQLVDGFFKSASHMLRTYGEVHVSHKIGDPFHKWDLEELASRSSLILVECVDFSIKDYPGYSNKRGEGPRCDQPFPLGVCGTFKFKNGGIHKKKRTPEALPSLGCKRSFTETMVANPSPFESFSSNHLPLSVHPCGRNLLFQVDTVRSALHYPLRTGISDLYREERGAYGLEAHHMFRNLEDPLRNSYQPYMNEAQRNTEFVYSNHLEEIRSQSVSRQALLRDLILKYG